MKQDNVEGPLTQLSQQGVSNAVAPPLVSPVQFVKGDTLMHETITGEASSWLINEQSFASWGAAREQLLLLHQQQSDALVIIAAACQAPLERMVSVLVFLAGEQMPIVQVLLDPDGAAISSDQTQ